MKGYHLLSFAAALIISAFIIGANAETGNCDPNDTGSCSYTLTGTELVISGSGFMKDYGTTSGTIAPWRTGTCSITKLTIKKGIKNVGEYAFYQCTNLADVTIEGSSVETIGSYAFQGCNISSFDIPKGVTTLGNYSFSGCTTLSSITFPSSLTTIKYGVFSNTGFTEFTFPAGISEIPPFLFSECSKIKNAYIPEGITKIGEKAFWNCNALTEVTIPSTVTDLHQTAFSRGDNQNNNLKNIYVHKCNPNYADIDGVLFTKDKKTLILYPGYHNARYRIPEGVTHIGPFAFDFVNRNIWEINFSSTVTTIGQNAFSNLGGSMTHLVIPKSVVSIDREAFFNNGALSIYYLGLHDPDPENKGAFLCPAGSGFGNLFLPIDYQDDYFSGRRVYVKNNATFDEFRGRDNKCYQAFYHALIQNYHMCANNPPKVYKDLAVFAMRPEAYDYTHQTLGCQRYRCENDTGIVPYDNCYGNKVCINGNCVNPPSSSSESSSSSDECNPSSSSDKPRPSSSSGESRPSSSSDQPHPSSSSNQPRPSSGSDESRPSHSSIEPRPFVGSGIRSTAGYVIVALAMAFALLI